MADGAWRHAQHLRQRLRGLERGKARPGRRAAAVAAVRPGRPALKKIRKLCREISELTDRRTCLRDTRAEVRMLNQKLQGWTNYFCLGPLVRVYDVVQKHVRRRLRRWLCTKHKVRTRKYARFPNEYLHDQLGLVQLDATQRRLTWAKA